MAMYSLCYLVKINWLAFQNSFQINVMSPCFVSNILLLDNFMRTALFYFFTGPFWICTTLVFTTAIAGTWQITYNTRATIMNGDMIFTKVCVGTKSCLTFHYPLLRTVDNN